MKGQEVRLCQTCPHLPEIFDAFCCDNFCAFFKREYFDRSVAAVANVLECLENRFEHDITEAGAFQVPVVGVEVGEVWPGFMDDLWDGLRF